LNKKGTKTESKPANPGSAAGPAKSDTKHPVPWTLLLLLVILSALFYRSYSSDYTLFSNDCPLGQMTAAQNRPPGTLTGSWADLNWLGKEGLNSSPTLSNLLLYLPTPDIWSRCEQPLTLLFVGLCACFCLCRMGLTPMACILGGLAAGLNSDFFSTSCWGVSSQTIGFGAMYVAVGLMYNPGQSWRRWVTVLVAGGAVGMGIMEAYDIGAIFSVFVASFVMFGALFLREGSAPEKIGKGVGQVALIAIFSAMVSAYALQGLIGTQLKDSAGAQQDAASKRERWDAYTWWSVPKIESLQVLIPGVFGFRQDWHMYENDQPGADQYWGLIGHMPGGGMWRLVGTGFYAGVPVVIISLWAIFQSFCRRGSAFTLPQRRSIWFWTGALVVSMLLAFGRNAPFYQFWYALPYASSIRNPQKFMHVFSWAIVIVFGYGVHGLIKMYMQTPLVRAGGMVAQYKSWYARAVPFEKKWMTGSIIAIVAAVFGWLIYASANKRLTDYIGTIGIDPQLAPGIAKFSLHAVGWFILLLLVTVALLALIFSGQFAGPRAKWGVLLLGVFVAADLGLADKPWIVYFSVPYKYQTDAIIDFLGNKPYEHRVSIFPIGLVSEQHKILFTAYGSHWKQELFPYKNIQCAEAIQEPRVELDKEQFMNALPQNNFFDIFRFWQLSSTRYVLGPEGMLPHLGAASNDFRVLKTFNFDPKRPNPSDKAEDYTAVESTNGQLAVYEFLAALPRARLFSNWQVVTNDEIALKTIGDPAFDPLKTVMVADANVPAPAPGDAAQPPGLVEITSYKPKHIELKADAKVPSVLLLTDKYNTKWQVEVDGKPAQLLRCDFILRGVRLDAGSHKIVMRFEPPLTWLYLTLASMFIGLVLAAVLIITKSAPEAAASAALVK
jgi:hypothetical protein